MIFKHFLCVLGLVIYSQTSVGGIALKEDDKVEENVVATPEATVTNQNVAGAANLDAPVPAVTIQTETTDSKENGPVTNTVPVTVVVPEGIQPPVAVVEDNKSETYVEADAEAVPVSSVPAEDNKNPVPNAPAVSSGKPTTCSNFPKRPLCNIKRKSDSRCANVCIEGGFDRGVCHNERNSSVCVCHYKNTPFGYRVDYSAGPRSLQTFLARRRSQHRRPNKPKQKRRPEKKQNEEESAEPSPDKASPEQGEKHFGPHGWYHPSKPSGWSGGSSGGWSGGSGGGWSGSGWAERGWSGSGSGWSGSGSGWSGSGSGWSGSGWSSGGWSGDGWSSGGWSDDGWGWNDGWSSGWSGDGWSSGWSGDGWSSGWSSGWSDDGWGWNDSGWSGDGWSSGVPSGWSSGWSDDGWGWNDGWSSGWSDDGWGWNDGWSSGWSDDGWSSGWSDDGWSSGGWSDDSGWGWNNGWSNGGWYSGEGWGDDGWSGWGSPEGGWSSDDSNFLELLFPNLHADLSANVDFTLDIHDWWTSFTNGWDSGWGSDTSGWSRSPLKCSSCECSLDCTKWGWVSGWCTREDGCICAFPYVGGGPGGNGGGWIPSAVEENQGVWDVTTDWYSDNGWATTDAKNSNNVSKNQATDKKDA